MCNKLRLEYFCKNIICFQSLKTYQFQLKVGPLWPKVHIFFTRRRKHFSRFSIIFHSQTVYYTYAINKKQNNNFCVLYSLSLKTSFTTLQLGFWFIESNQEILCDIYTISQESHCVGVLDNSHEV